MKLVIVALTGISMITLMSILIKYDKGVLATWIGSLTLLAFIILSSTGVL